MTRTRALDLTGQRFGQLVDGPLRTPVHVLSPEVRLSFRTRGAEQVQAQEGAQS